MCVVEWLAQILKWNFVGFCVAGLMGKTLRVFWLRRSCNVTIVCKASTLIYTIILDSCAYISCIRIRIHRVHFLLFSFINLSDVIYWFPIIYGHLQLPSYVNVFIVYVQGVYIPSQIFPYCPIFEKCPIFQKFVPYCLIFGHQFWKLEMKMPRNNLCAFLGFFQILVRPLLGRV